MRVKATIEVSGTFTWASDVSAVPSLGVCVVGNEWPLPLYIDRKPRGHVTAIDHMDTTEVYGDELLPLRSIIHSTSLDCLLDL